MLWKISFCEQLFIPGWNGNNLKNTNTNEENERPKLMPTVRVPYQQKSKSKQ
jgi:hypothetical protein